MILFSEEEKKYLIDTPIGPYICYESKTPTKILEKLKKKNDASLEMVGDPIIVFEK